MTPANAAPPRRRLRDAALLSATMLATGLVPAQAAQFGGGVTQLPDPLLSGLAIPDNAPSAGMWSSLQNWPRPDTSAATGPS